MLDLFALNDILAAAGFPTVTNTLDLDLEKTSQSPSQLQKHVLKYFSCCQRRVVEDTVIEDYKFTKQVKQY
jgi:hypothetical protein